MEIQLNGERRSVPPGTTIASLLVENAMNPQYVAVEVNLQLVPRREHLNHRLQDGDSLEVVTLVGGG